MQSDPDIEAELHQLLARLRTARETKLGFPGAEDIDYGPLAPFLEFELNNIGDPYTDPAFEHHTKPQEREAIEFFADLFRAPADDRWGIVTSGSTEAVRNGLRRARDLYPDGVAYHTTAAHYKVPHVLDDLRIPAVAVPTDEHGEMDYAALRSAVARHRHRPAIILATAGTTMTEAVDDLGAIAEVLDGLGNRDRYIHVDAALSGVPLALLPIGERPRFDFADGADSISFSSHKFFAGRWPGGLILTTHNAMAPGAPISYTGAADAGFSGSRNGHTALQLWFCVRTLGREGMRRRAEQARLVAAHAVQRLQEVGWEAWRHAHAFTVVLRTPPAGVSRKWQLADGKDGWSHTIWLPGRTAEQVDSFVADLVQAHPMNSPQGWPSRALAVA
jgi:histidine decarboxylase